MLFSKKEQLKERWAAGEFTDLNQNGLAILNAKAIGQCETLEELFELEYEQFLTEIEPDERAS